ncbi:MAG: cellulose biosynthesis protein BcsS, partial [Pseudolabrys sp.]
AFAHGGFLFAQSGLDQGGLLLKILFASGLYRYDAKNFGGERVIGAEGLAHVLAGWRVFEKMLGGIYVGPVIEYFGSDGYRHLRLGAYITSMRTEDTEWSAAAGWAQDSQGRASPYLRLNMLKRL